MYQRTTLLYAKARRLGAGRIAAWESSLTQARGGRGYLCFGPPRLFGRVNLYLPKGVLNRRFKRRFGHFAAGGKVTRRPEAAKQSFLLRRKAKKGNSASADAEALFPRGKSTQKHAQGKTLSCTSQQKLDTEN